MGELIKREVPSRAMPFVGERFTNADNGQSAIEHLHRVLMARQYCANKDVLDIASGEGYGSAMLAQVARSVIGVDVSEEAVTHAQAAYESENLAYVRGSALAIPLTDNSVDVVVSFETIEHFAEHVTFLTEVRRVLRPGGLALISTPDLAVYSPESEPVNPFHIREMTRDEFRELLSDFFPHIAFVGQRTMVGSALVVDRALTGHEVHAPVFTYEERSVQAFERSTGLARAKYIVAFASDTAEAISDLEQSVFISTSEIDRVTASGVEFRNELERVRTELHKYRESEIRWRSDIEALAGRADVARNEAKGLREQLQLGQQQLHAEIEGYRAEIARITADREQLIGEVFTDVARQTQAKLEQMNAELHSFRESELCWRSDIEKLTRLAGAARSEADALRQQLQCAQQQLHAEIGDHRAEMARIMADKEQFVGQFFAEIARQAGEKREIVDRLAAEMVDREARQREVTDMLQTELDHARGQKEQLDAYFGAWTSLNQEKIEALEAKFVAQQAFSESERRNTVERHIAELSALTMTYESDKVELTLEIERQKKLLDELAVTKGKIDSLEVKLVAQEAFFESEHKDMAERQITELSAVTMTYENEKAELMHEIERHENAREELTSVISRHEEEAVRREVELDGARSETSGALQRMGEIQRELEELRSSTERDSESFKARVQEQEAVLRDYRSQAPEHALTEAIIRHHGAEWAPFSEWMNVARRILSVQDYGRAESYYRLAVLANPLAGEAWRGYAESLNARGQHEAAIAAWNRAIAIDAGDVLALRGLGVALIKLGRSQEGLIELQKAFALRPSLPDLANQLAALGVTTARMVETALNVVHTETRPRSVLTDELSQFFEWRKARRAERHGRVREAARRYKAIATKTSDDASLLRLGDAVARVSGPDSARDVYIKALTVAPTKETIRKRALDVKYGTLAFDVEICADIRQESDGSYLTVSDDGQFELKPDGRDFPAGWTLISVAAEAPYTAIRPVIYVWFGEHGQDLKAFTLPMISGKREVRCLLPLPEGIKRMRLDPTGEAGVVFRLHRVSWLYGTTLEGHLFTPALTSVAFVGEVPADLESLTFVPSLKAMRLSPDHDVVAEDEGWFRSIGHDPQFGLTWHEDLPSGWTWIEVAIEGMSAPIQPMLYAWTEDEVSTVYLPRMDRPGTVRALIRLPNIVSALRFDPTIDIDVRFRLGAVRFAVVDSTAHDRAFLPLEDGQLPGQIALMEEIEAEIGAAGLEPLQQLDALPDGLFRTTGSDSRFALMNVEAIPLGLVKISIEIEQASCAVDSILYAFRNGDLTDPVRYSFNYLESARRYDNFIYLPEGTTALHFVPTDQSNVVLSAPKMNIVQVSTGDDAAFTVAIGQADVDLSQTNTAVAQLQVVQHLAERDGVYQSTGNDPQFAVSFDNRSMPTGWTVVSIEMNLGAAVARPILYVWTDDSVIPLVLPSMTGNVRKQQLVRLPDRVTNLRFDPLEYEGGQFSNVILSFAPASAFSGRILLRHGAGGRGLEYSAWCECYDTLSEQDHHLIRDSIERFEHHPLISIVMPVYNPESRFLRRALDTVINQIYSNWELCIAEDCSPNEEIRNILREYMERDERVKVVFRTENGHISRASNSAIELVRGTFVALMDHDDEIPAHALYMVAREINLYPNVDIIYSDEDKVDANGRRHDPHFKTDWNQELFYSQNMVAHLGVYRTSLVREVGGFRAGFEGSQDYDFTLRVLRLTSAERIRHIPHVLYHWRIFEGVRTFSSNNPLRSIETAKQAMIEYFSAAEPDSEVVAIDAFPSWWRIKRRLPVQVPSVTIIIPTRDRIELVRNCMEGLLNRTDYADLDVIIVDNGSVKPESLDYFTTIVKDSRVQVLRDDRPFNYSRLNNEAAKIARGEYLCFLNNDIEVIGEDWLIEMMSQAIQSRVGAVGARLLYANGTLQHAGVTLGIYGVAAHGHRHFPGDSIGYFGHPQLVREASAVTAAALLMPKTLFHDVGGFDESNLVVSYNDVDLCLRVVESGRRVVYTPFAALYHLESATRGADISPEQKELQRVERGFMRARWGRLLDRDPHYSLNLTLANEDYHLAFPSRAGRPWQDEADIVERLSRHGRSTLSASSTQGLSRLAADIAIVLASSTPFVVLESLMVNLSSSGPKPEEVIVVDNTARRDAFVREGTVAAFRAAHPDVKLTVIDDLTQDFNASRTANLGIAALNGEQSTVVVITEDCIFPTAWFETLLMSWQSLDNIDVVMASQLFVRENCANGGVLTDGYLEVPVIQTELDVALIRPVGPSYDGLKLADRADPRDMFSRNGVEAEELLVGGVIMARREKLLELSGGSSAVFDPLFMTSAARMEDMSRRLKALGTSLYSALAPVVVLTHPRMRDVVHLWQYWHDYVWLNRKANGVTSNDVIEFVCPFHRGDVLIGLQVAHTAHRTGLSVRFHVAEGLMGWVRDFAPDFPVEPLPVPVPPAHETALYLLRSYEHVVARADSSSQIARSHPFRGLDAMNGNLAAAMLAAVGLPDDTPILSLEPLPSAEQTMEAEMLLAPYGDRVILVHPSGGWGLKTLPDPVLTRFAAIVKTQGFKLVQIGGADDMPIAQADGVINRNLSAGHWSALFRRASAVAGVDSWSSHMAAILDVPQITFYGSTHPDHVASKRHFERQAAPALLIPPTVACSPCNSLTCLIQPGLPCAGYSADQEVIANFLQKLPFKEAESRRSDLH